MRKKKKLELHCETLAILQDPRLGAVAGGGETAISVCKACATGTRCNISLCICQ